jgi:hypothetical protein
MSIFRNDTLGSWTRGGQATVHNVRMTTQVFKQTTLAGLVLWVMLTVWFVYETLHDSTRTLLGKMLEAWIQLYVVGSPASRAVSLRRRWMRCWLTTLCWLPVVSATFWPTCGQNGLLSTAALTPWTRSLPSSPARTKWPDASRQSLESALSTPQPSSPRLAEQKPLAKREILELG